MSIKNKMRAFFLTVSVVFVTSASLGYQVWYGLPYMPKESQTNLDQWDLLATQVKGLNLNPVDTQRPDEDRNSTADWKAIIQAMPTAKNNCMIGVPRTHFFYDGYGGSTKPPLAEMIHTKFKQEGKYACQIKWVMPFDNQPGEDRTLPIEEWSDAELQELRDWLDTNHPGVKLLANIRNNGVRNNAFARKTIVDGMSIEAKAELWYGNNGSRQTFLKNAVADPLTKDKYFKFQMPFGGYDGESQYQAMRGFMRWLSNDLLESTELVRRPDTVFLVITYGPGDPHLPEMSDDETEYENTMSSLALSIIEQKDMFEGTAPGGLITKAQTMSYERLLVDPPAVPTSGMVAHWALDEGSGTAAADLTGNGFDGELLNGVMWDSDAERGTYAVFDGTDDRITTSFTYALADTNDFTWAWWANKQVPAGQKDGSIMVGSRYGDTGSENYEFIKFTPVSVQFANTSSTTEIERYDYADIPQNEWHHYAMVKSGTSYQWYVDGVAQGVASNFNYSETSPIPFLIGGDDDGSGTKVNEHFEGCIDDVILYREALTPAEVVDVKNGNYPYPPPVYELIAGWDVWDSGSTPAASFTAPNVAGSAATTTEQLAWHTTDERGASNDGTWGTHAGPPAADTTVGTNDNQNLELPNATTGGTIIFTISNNGSSDIELNAFHFDAYAFRPKAARTYELSVLAGSGISTGIVFTSAAQAITEVGGANANDAHDDIDHSLLGLADHTLGTGESVQFLLAFSGGTGDGSGGHDLWVDNVGLTGAFATAPPVDPPVLELGMSGGDMEFNWTGNGFKVQSRTNLMDGAWFDVPGGDVPPVNVIPTNGAVFFRLIQQ